MKVLIRGISTTDFQALKDRGHSAVALPEDLPLMETLNKIAGSNALVMSVYQMHGSTGSVGNFLLGVAVALDKDVVLITERLDGFWDDIPNIRLFPTFESFLVKAEGGLL